MSKKSTKVLASATLMSLVLTTALTTGPAKAAAGSVTRVGGADRYATAAQVATENWAEGSENVVLVSGQGYADSVSASVLAKKLNAPILLTTSDKLSADASAALTKLSPKNVYVIGGTGSISDAIESGLKGTYSNVVRLGGKDRYDTNLAVAQKLVDLGVSKDNIIAVAGTGFSDALSVAPVAAAKDEILLLTNNSVASLSATTDFAKDANVTVVGTTNVVSDAVYDALKADSRVNGGADRFETNLNVLNKFDSDLKADKLYAANASGQGYADALVASAVAGKYSAPLVLLDTEDAAATSNAVKYIGTKATKTTDLQVVGGTGVVTDATVSAINKAVNPDNNGGDAEVSSIEAVGLNQIKVVFGEEVDSDTAEEVTNYKVDGSQLKDDGSTYASLQDDNKTVLITLADAQKQYDDVDVTVKKGILTADKSETVPEFTQTVTFSDTTVPTLDSVEAKGNTKLTVKFSEPVNIGPLDKSDIDDGDAKIAGNSTFLSKFKIDGQNISGFGLDPELTLSKNTVSDGTNGWADEIDFYFNSSLTNGNKTLKISDGEKDKELSDAAGFTFQETSEDFDVDTLTTEPEIESITAEDTGKVYINFDRPMDAKTAQDEGNYKINDKAIPADSVSLKKGDTQVKISGVSGLLNKNSNTIYIDDNVKDAYGNKVADDTYKSFELEEDTTKPSVTSVTTLDDTTIRVRFSKDVDSEYATSKSNYKLKDNSGNDITDDSKKGISGINKVTDDVYDIYVKAKLTDSKYTLTIKNIQDTAKTPNVMDDDVVTFDGSDSVAPVANQYAIALENDNDSNPYRKVVVTFNKEMDGSSLTDTDNYKFKNGSGDTKALPSGTSISTSSDNKSATLEFPSAYGTAQSGKTGDNLVTDIAVIGVKDSNGNALDVSQVLPVKTAEDADETGATVKENSVKVYYDGDNLKVNVGFDKAIDNLVYGDFTLNGVVPDSGYKNSDGTITLIYNDDSNSTKIDDVKSAGLKAELAIKDNSETKDVTGLSLNTITGVTPYYYQAAPKTYDTDNWTANSADKTVTVKFDTPIEQSSVKPGDFTFVAAGTTLSAKTAEVGTGTASNTVTFTFDTSKSDVTDKFVAGASIKVTPKTTNKISTLEDKNDEYAYYVPSDDDLTGYTITASGTTYNGPKLKDESTATGVVNTAIDLTQYFTDSAITNPTDSNKFTYNVNGTPISGTSYTPTAAGTYTVTATNEGKTSAALTLTVTAEGTTPTYTIKTGTLSPGSTSISLNFGKQDLSNWVITIDGEEVTPKVNKNGDYVASATVKNGSREADESGILTDAAVKGIVTIAEK